MRYAAPRSSLVAVLALVLVACLTDTTINLSDFDTSCVQDQDCVTVQVGDICGCDCGNAAINAKDLLAYRAELAETGSHCTVKSFCECQGSPSAVCTAGRCVFVPP